MAKKKKPRTKVTIRKHSIEVEIDITDALKVALRELDKTQKVEKDNEARNQDY